MPHPEQRFGKWTQLAHGHGHARPEQHVVFVSVDGCRTGGRAWGNSKIYIFRAIGFAEIRHHPDPRQDLSLQRPGPSVEIIAPQWGEVGVVVRVSKRSEERRV